MSLEQFLGSWVNLVFTLFLLVAVTWLVARTSRRVLGIQISHVRAIGTSIAVVGLFLVFFPLLPGFSTHGTSSTAPRIIVLLACTVLGAFALGVLVLMVLEVIVPTGSLPSLRTVVTGRRNIVRRWRRYMRITWIIGRHGLHAQLRGVLARNQLSTTAEQVRHAMEDAGITFVKLGQMLSTRADLIPEPFVRELAKLTNQAEPQSYKEIFTVLNAELGPALSRLEIDDDPLASASVAQVYAATLDGSTPVVVKVQRVGATEQVMLDLEILEQLAVRLDANASWAHSLGIVDIVRGFADSVREELDYAVELSNMTSMRAWLADTGVAVPAAYPELCTSKVIVMERFDGIPIADAHCVIESLPAQTRKDSAQVLLGAIVDQILTSGTFHADLHSGNVLIWPDGSVGLLDFGSVGRLDASSRRNLGLLLYSVDADDPALATDAVTELLDHDSGLDERTLQRNIGTIITRMRANQTGSSIAFFQQLFDVVMSYQMTVPHQIAIAIRSLGSLEGTLRQLDPDLQLVASARNLARASLGDISASGVKAQISNQVVRLVPLMEHLPRRLNRIAEQLETGSFTTHMRVVSHTEDRAFLIGLANQIVVAILAGFAVVAAVFLVTTSGGPVIYGIRLWDLLGYLLGFAGFVLALRSVAMVFGRRT